MIYEDYRFNESSLVIAQKQSTKLSELCSQCTLKTGSWIEPAPDFKPGIRNEKIDDDSFPTCPIHHQCVGTSDMAETGCCVRCTWGQICSPGTISLSGYKDAAKWNQCPDGHVCDSQAKEESIKKCEAGSMCHGGHKMSCQDARKVPIDAGYGDLHAGSYCPAGSSGMVFCEQGNYCNATNMTQSLPCPEGFFCPLKTSDPTIICKGCNKGATSLMSNVFVDEVLYTLSSLFGLGFVVCCINLFMSRKSKIKIKKGRRIKQHERRLSGASKASDGSDADTYLYEDRRIAHLLDLIQSRVDNMTIRNVDCGTFDLHADFACENLFDQLDMDCNGILSFNELNIILQLSETQIKYFVREMNKEAGVESNTKTVSKQTFVNHFYECISNASYFDPTAQEAAEIFDTLDLNGDGFIQGLELHISPINGVLTPMQIQSILKNFRKKIKKTNSSHGPLCISKEDFIKYYPTLLNDIILSQENTNHISRGIDIAFEKLKLTTKVSGKEITIVDSVTGRIQESTMTAIMGGSGAGKTSLLNALCGRAFYGDVTGDIKINGKAGRIEDHRNVVGFVPQDDIVYGELSVRENFLYAGRFRLPKGTSASEIAELADDVIVNLGLVKVRDSVVGDVRRRGISGGEKKRVNIGLELMSRPRILFLDEPTSGLDASSSSLVMQSLKNLVSDHGVTIASVIHQPRKFIYDLFDNIILLGQGGKIVYHGPTEDAEAYFIGLGYELTPGENVADWFLDISSGRLELPVDGMLESLGGKFSKKRVNQSIHVNEDDNLKLTKKYLYSKWRKYFNSRPEDIKAQYVSPKPFAIPPEVSTPSFISQFFIQLRRNFLVSRRNIMSKLVDTCIIVIAVAIVASIDGTVDLVRKSATENPIEIPLSVLVSKNIDYLPLTEMFRPFQAAAFDMIADALKVGVIASVLVGLAATKAISEKKLEFFREASSGYNIDAYFAAITVTSTIEHSVQLLLAGLACAVLRQTPSSWYALIANFIMLGWICTSWAFLFSIIVPPKNLVLVTGFFMAFNGLLLGGGIPPVEYKNIYDSEFLAVLSGFLSPTRYFMEAFVVNDFKVLPEQTGFTQGASSTKIPGDLKSFSKTHLGQRSSSVGTSSINGWFWGFLPAFFLGLTIRLLASVLIHATDRSQQNKPTILKALRTKKWRGGEYLRILILLTFIMLVVTLYLIIAERN